MKKSDIYICGFMYAFSFFFLYLTQSFPLGARHYPHFVIGLLLILTSVRVGQMVRDYRREKTSENDMPVLFDGFMPKQFWTMFAAFILYFVMMYLVGFYPASLVYLLFCLKFGICGSSCISLPIPCPTKSLITPKPSPSTVSWIACEMSCSL